jgi:predicted Zn-dependent protease with MMP-like domain
MSLESGNPRGWKERLGIAQAVVKATLASLPEPIKKETQALPVTYEPRPSAEMIEDGIEPDTLGLFLGNAFPDLEYGHDPLPPQILLFLDNLWEFCEDDEAAYRHEVRATLLHELGHYLGLDETDLEARGLD